MLDKLLNNVVSTKTLKDVIVESKPKDSNLDDLYGLVQHESYVGEVVELQYKTAVVQINDHYRQKVGGIASQTFLIATRINPEAPGFPEVSEVEEYEKEDCSVILLRVLDSAELPVDIDRKRLRAEIAQESNDVSGHWEQNFEASAKRMMSFAGVACRVIGTFYLDKPKDKLELCFGSDLSNFYPNRGLKVYKPKMEALENIVNFGLNNSDSIGVGTVRYSSTMRNNKSINNVPVKINPDDLVAQKTAIFGMTRTGKSNTVKTIVKAIYQMRFLRLKPKTIGQIIFDPNGEYANDNLQDKDDSTGQAQSIKNIWKIPLNQRTGDSDDVKIYSLSENKSDPNRTVMKINFFDDSLIGIGKDLIDNKIESDGANTSAHYMRNFINLSFEKPDAEDYAQKTRYERRLLVYKTLLVKAGFKPISKKIEKTNVFSEDFLNALKIGVVDNKDTLISDAINTIGLDGGNSNSNNNDSKLMERDSAKLVEKKKKYFQAYETLNELYTVGSTYDELIRAFEIVDEYIKDAESNFADFNREYIKKSTTKSTWTDNDLEVLLNMFSQSNASRQIAKAVIFHSEKSKGDDYANLIYKDLEQGRLVIVDQALGDSQMNKIAANRIVKKIFIENSKKFADAKEPTDILIFVEEAHNLMPKGSDEDVSNIWARVAKEGAKFKIGMIYSTQEVSSIQRNILKNTTNWFISHLNNKEEVRALEDYYDFEDFSSSILSAEDKGFIRMKTRSNKFVVPVQIDKFQIRG